MKLGVIILTAVSSSLIACGGGSGNSTNTGSGGEGGSVSIQDCQVALSTINLAHGSSCNLTRSDADLFGLTAGLVQCNNGVITYEGNELSSGTASINLNGLNFVCSVNG